MSDTSEGPGWWQASDGKWYPPELYPKDYPKPDEVAETTAAPAAEPAVEAEPVGEPTAAVDMTEIVAPPASVPPATPPADAVPPLGGPPTDPAHSATTTFQQPDIGEATAAVPSGLPQQGWGDTTSVYAPSEPPDAAPAGAASGSNVPAALIALVAAALAIVGSFLEWAKPAQDGEVVLPAGIANITVPSFDGLDSNGVGTLVCGAVMALVAGLLLANVRHIMFTVALVVAGVVAIGLFVYSFVDINGLDIKINGTKVEGIGFDPGVGLWVVLGGGVLSVLAGLVVKRS